MPYENQYTRPFSPRKKTEKLIRGEGARRADEGKAFARQLRQNATEAEKRIWYYLRNRRLEGYKFIRQVPIGPYIVDFLCRAKKLVVELDGSQHLDNPYDIQRTKYLGKNGYRVIRFWNDDVLIETDIVLTSILDALRC